MFDIIKEYFFEIIGVTELDNKRIESENDNI